METVFVLLRRPLFALVAACLAAAPLFAVEPGKVGAANRNVAGDFSFSATLRPQLVNDGDDLLAVATVRSAVPIVSVTADLGGMATIELHPDKANIDSRSGFTRWRGTWACANLVKGTHAATFTATDAAGSVFVDRSEFFSHAAAGLPAPGANDYPNGGLLEIGDVVTKSTGTIDCVATDLAKGIAYFGTADGLVVKVAMGDGTNPPRQIGRTDTQQRGSGCAVIDPAAGYAYFTTARRVEKVALGEDDEPPSLVAVAEVEAGLLSGVIDTANGYAYFGSVGYEGPAYVVKVALGKGDAPPRRVGAAVLEAGGGRPECAVIDAVNGYAYFGVAPVSYLSPSRIVKVALGNGSNPPVRVGTLALDGDHERYVHGAVIDASAGNAFFAAGSVVVKVALGAGDSLPARVGASMPVQGDWFSGAAGIDADQGLAWFGTGSGKVVKMALGAPGEPPARAAEVRLLHNERILSCMAIDPARGNALVGSELGDVVKIALGDAGEAPERIASFTLDHGEVNFTCGVVDGMNGRAYFGTQRGRVFMMALGAGDDPPRRIGSILLDGNGWSLDVAAIDQMGGHAYFTDERFPTINKVALAKGDRLPKHVASVRLPLENYLSNGNELSPFSSMVVDGQKSLAFLGMKWCGGVAKISLGEGAEPPSLLDVGLMDDRIYATQCLGVDPQGKHVYLFTKGDLVRIVKLAIGEFDDPLAEVASLDLAGEEITSGAIDPAAEFGYFATTSRGPWPESRLLKVALGSGSAAPSLVGAVAAGTEILEAAYIDPRAGNIYFTGHDVGIAKFGPRGGGALPRLRAFIDWRDSREKLTMVLDAERGYGYVASSTAIAKVALDRGRQGLLNTTPIGMAESGHVDEFRFYSHQATGNLRFAIYEGIWGSATLLWQSGVVPNTGNGGQVVVPISAGAPDSLFLMTHRDYLLAWETDSPADVGSCHEFGWSQTYRRSFDDPLPAALGDFIMEDVSWATSITYTPLATDASSSDFWIIR